MLTAAKWAFFPFVAAVFQLKKPLPGLPCGMAIASSELIMTCKSESSMARLLVVDDCPVERLALSHYLRSAGFTVDEVADGASAVAYVKNRDVDLMVLDLEMPTMDGFDVLKYLQVHRRSLPVVLLSGMPLHQIQQKMHVLPTQELPPLLIKPICLQQLLGVLDLQLNGGLPGTVIPEPSDSTQIVPVK
jgi:CheY-like chemotaxis protein